MSAFPWIELVGLGTGGVVTFILNQISVWENYKSFVNRPHYMALDYGSFYTITANRFKECGEYPDTHLVDFSLNMGTSYIEFFFYIYFALTLIAMVFSLGVKVLKFLKRKDNIQDKERIRLLSKIEFIHDLLAFCASVPAFYAFKVHYGDCIEVTGNLSWLLNDSVRIFGNIGFYIFFVVSFLYYKKINNGIRTIGTLYLILFFIAGCYINYGYFVGFQIGWSIYLLLDQAVQLFTIISNRD